MSVDVLTPGERQLVESAQPRRDDLVHLVYRLVAEVERLRRSGTQHCPVCEANAKEIERLRGALKSLCVERAHGYCEDSWYSCPKHPEGCADDSAGSACRCGADAWNELVASASAVLGEEKP